MCFFVYAPKAKITIHYASESITLSKHGKSTVVADLLISNDSDTVINELNIIYPNQFFQFKEVSSEVYPVGEYEDLTGTILEDDSAYNWAYKDNFNLTSFKLHTSPNGTEDASNILQTLELTLPHPLDPSEVLSYVGQIGGEIEIKPLQGLTYIQWLMLQRIHYTIFTANFVPPIEPNATRWVRWKFIGRSAVAHNYRSKKSKILLRYKNQLQNDYQIQGMYDVKNQFMELLSFLKANTEKYSVRVDLVKDVEELVGIFKNSGLSYPGREMKNLLLSNVRILDWRLHINPSDLGRLTDIVMKGCAEIIGRVPNYVEAGDKTYPVYEWKAGPNVTYSNEPGKEYSFSIFFQSKEYSWLADAVYVSSIIAIVIILLLILFGRII